MRDHVEQSRTEAAKAILNQTCKAARLGLAGLQTPFHTNHRCLSEPNEARKTTQLTCGFMDNNKDLPFKSGVGNCRPQASCLFL